uniref:Exostosin-2 n=1 Tax=Lepeophtheirus salmonis TaxID=72036 RepID=A0A0K2T5T3_LEPSM
MDFKRRTASLGALILLSILLTLWSLGHRLQFHSSSIKQSQLSPTKRNCGYYDCLDVYRCGTRERNMLIHIPDMDSYQTHLLSNEFLQILKTVKNSVYYTPFPRKACFVLLPVDTLIDDPQLGSVLSKYPEWDHGTNVLIFNILPGIYPDFRPTLETPIGSALLAGSGLSTLHYRRGFDVSFPTPPTIKVNMSLLQEKNRLLLLAQIDIRPKFHQIINIIEQNYSVEFIHWKECSNLNLNTRCRKTESSPYTELLENEATFCLILPGLRLGQSGLLEAMGSGCLPVIAIDSLVLPFSEVLDWKLFSVQIYERELKDVISILKGISKEKINQMKQKMVFVYDNYFSSVEAMTKTTLQILNDRIFPHFSKTYREWNYPELVSNPLSFQSTPPDNDGFTAVILTYDRLDSLINVVYQISETPSLVAIVVVWNSKSKPPLPSSSIWPNIDKPLKIIQSSENILSNRFFPYEEIETECILSMDDDIPMLTTDELEFGYHVWREFPDRLVGFPSRSHITTRNGSWKYESEWTSEISMVLTGAAFYHKYWNHVFSSGMDPVVSKMKSWVDGRMNCEDIAMNFLIANMTGQAPIKVTPRKKFRCSTPECLNVNMISGGLTHMVERSECVNHFAHLYGYMPLTSVEFRADPILFKDPIPARLKKYPNLGTL